MNGRLLNERFDSDILSFRFNMESWCSGAALWASPKPALHRGPPGAISGPCFPSHLTYPNVRLGTPL